VLYGNVWYGPGTAELVPQSLFFLFSPHLADAFGKLRAAGH
jgi:hypothetical protein